MKTHLHKNKAVIKSATISPYPHLYNYGWRQTSMARVKKNFRKRQLALGEICSGSGDFYIFLHFYILNRLHRG